jgi:transcriptional regulator with XRE-family HTH domain
MFVRVLLVLLNGSAIVDFREKEGLRQKDLAEQAGISVSYLCEIEKGRDVDVSPPVAKRISDVLTVRVSSLVRTESLPPAPAKAG